MTTLEERIRAIEDRDQIRELTARYCHSIAKAEAAAVVDLFCEDGIFEMGERVVRGRGELEEFYSVVSDSPPIPFIQNHVIELDGDQASGLCSVEIRIVQQGEAYTAAGWYDDHYRREGDRWRFAHRLYHVFQWVPLSKGRT